MGQVLFKKISSLPYLTFRNDVAIKEYLREVKEIWQKFKPQCQNYRNKGQIIQDWDNLFNKVQEHKNSLSAMKLSPNYKEFEEEVLLWEVKLNQLNEIFDVWINVQRRLVYLDGIFDGSVESRFPKEAKNFQNVSLEYFNLMSKVNKLPMVLDILKIQGLQKILIQLVDLLNTIEKSLGEYLERERSSFPRFYFVGDEDLLEIIGNSKNVPSLQKHFKKMFSGVHSILLNDENTQVLGVVSKEGEQVLFKSPVSIEANAKVSDWLALVECEIRNTLALSLFHSVQESNQFETKNRLKQGLSIKELKQTRYVLMKRYL